MSKIILSEPDGPYSCELDPGVMQVTLREVFNGVIFETEGGEKLGVCMRDKGFEVHYLADFGEKGFDMGWTEFKDGVIKHKGRN